MPCDMLYGISHVNSVRMEKLLTGVQDIGQLARVNV